MKNYRNLVSAFALAGALASFPGIAHAQAEVPAAVVAEPVISKIVSTVVPKKDPPGTLWLRAQVIHADAQSMIVQEQVNPKMIHTFSYTPALQGVMHEVQNNGGYRYGDKVKILYQQAEPGKFVALRIKGKPS